MTRCTYLLLDIHTGRGHLKAKEKRLLRLELSTIRGLTLQRPRTLHGQMPGIYPKLPIDECAGTFEMMVLHNRN